MKFGERFFGALAVALLALPEANASVEAVESLLRFIGDHLRVDAVECTKEVRDRHEGAEIVCVHHGGRWSAFKSDWEFTTEGFDLPASLQAGSEWTFTGGRYTRVYHVEGSKLTVVYDERNGMLELAYGLGELDEQLPESAQAGRRSRAGPAVAGFGGVTTPRPLEQPEPAYPGGALASGVEGTVLLEALIREDGTIGDLKVLRETPEGQGFAEAALAAVRHWLYEPARRDGRPVDALFTLTVEFELPPEGQAPAEEE